MKTVLYVAEPGACLRQTHARLRVTKGSELLAEVRLADVERVVMLSGTAGITGPAASCLMESGIDTAFLGPWGELRGWMSAARSRGVGLRLAQYSAFQDPQRRLDLARRIVAGKIANADAFLARWQRNHPGDDLYVDRARLRAAEESVGSARSIGELLGREGDAAATYFAVLGRIVAPAFRFTTRSRRPPRDPANALLSYGYALLAAEAASAVAAVGLDPELGMLHAPDEGRPSLALDLMEEFRVPAVDRLVLALANRRELAPGRDFDQIDGGIRLQPAARRRFLEAWESRMRAPATGAPTGLRDAIRQQARSLARSLREGAVYRPFALR